MEIAEAFKTLFAIAPGGITMATDVNCVDFQHNQYAEKFFRISPRQNDSGPASADTALMVCSHGARLLPEQLPIQQAIREERTIKAVELEFIWPDQVRKVAVWNAAPLYDDAGVLCGGIATFEEITAQKQLEEFQLSHDRFLEKEMKRIEDQLSRSNQFITNILDSMEDSFFAVDDQWRYTYTNREHETAHGLKREEILGKCIWDVHPYEVGSKFYEEYHIAMADQVPRHFECCGLTVHKNDCLEVHVYPSKSGLLVYYRNITEKKVYEHELARLDRLNLIAQMSAGISHEIRNPLTTVRGFLQILMEKPEYAAEMDIFNLMITEMDRANGIISEYLSLAKDKTLHLQEMDLNSLIDKLAPLIIANAMTEDKYVEVIKGDIPQLLLDENEIRQLVLNLVRNGLEAMAAGKSLTISTRMEGDQPVLEIRDQGPGIAPEVLEKMGTPFYTTKERGTGLGLAICYTIASRHNAKIEIKSSRQGTSFIIRFNQPEGSAGEERGFTVGDGRREQDSLSA